MEGTADAAIKTYGLNVGLVGLEDGTTDGVDGATELGLRVQYRAGTDGFDVGDEGTSTGAIVGDTSEGRTVKASTEGTKDHFEGSSVGSSVGDTDASGVTVGLLVG